MKYNIRQKYGKVAESHLEMKPKRLYR